MTEWFEEKVRGRRNRENEKDVKAKRVKEAEYHSKGYGQAVVKVYSYSNGPKAVSSHAKYLSRSGELPVEVGGKDGEDNLILTDLEEVKDVLEDWAHDFDTFKNSRDVANITLSAPVGSPRDKVESAARSFSREYFSNTEYMFVVHNDTQHPHAHLMVKMRDHDNEKIRLDKKQLREMRETFAEKLRDRGVNVGSSYRTDRGVFRKAFPLMAKHIRERAGQWNGDKNLKEEAKKITKSIMNNEKMEKPDYLTAMEKKHSENVSFYQDLAKDAESAGDAKQAQRYRDAIKKFDKPETQVFKLAKESLKELMRKEGRRKSTAKDNKDIER